VRENGDRQRKGGEKDWAPSFQKEGIMQRSGEICRTAKCSSAGFRPRHQGTSLRLRGYSGDHLPRRKRGRLQDIWGTAEQKKILPAFDQAQEGDLRADEGESGEKISYVN